MARVSTYLNFNGTTEEAFLFYKSVFGTEFVDPGISRMGDAPPQEGQAPLSDAEKNLVMHVSLPILGGHVLMGTDASVATGVSVKFGNNIYLNLEPDTRTEVDELFTKLSEGGVVEMEPQVMFWGDYFASCTDKYGVGWMLNTSSAQ